ncbi:MAG: CsbD family protein [Geobacteraceae bacterium]|nr:CsbD family protein [Geobacteraceae bacterium]
MRGSTKNLVAGKFHQAKGEVKEAFGKAMNIPKVAMEGRAEKIAGKVEEKFGKIKKAVGR